MTKAPNMKRFYARLQRLEDWIRAEGERSDVCTYDVLGEVCSTCKCRRTHAKQEAPPVPAVTKGKPAG
jgi:hypothetical protein